MIHYTLHNNQHCTDLQLPTHHSLLMIIAPTGSGKTEWAVQNYDTFDMVFPTKMVGLSKSKKYHIPFIQQGVYPDQSDKRFGTFDAIRKFTHTDVSNRTLIIDESHQHILSAGTDFRRDVIRELFDSFPLYKNVVLLTGTPIITSHPILSQFVVVTVSYQQQSLIPYSTIQRRINIHELCDHLIKDRLNVVFCNNKKRLLYYDRYFQSKGYTTLRVTADTIQEQSCQTLIDTGIIDPNITILLTTSVISECIDIYNTNLGTIFFLSYDDPAVIKQFVSRFRCVIPNHVYIYIYAKQYNRVSYDILEEERFFLQGALSKIDVYNSIVSNESIEGSKLVEAIRDDMKLEFADMYRYMPDCHQYVIDYTGIAYHIRSHYVSEMYANKTLLIHELTQYGCVYHEYSYITYNDDTSEKTKFQKTIRDEQEQLRNTELATLLALGEQQTYTLQSQTVDKLREISHYHIDFNTSITLLKNYGSSQTRFNTLLKKLRTLEFRKHNYVDVEGTIQLICSVFKEHFTFTSDELLYMLHCILSRSGMYHQCLTQNRAIRLLRNYVTLRSCKIYDDSGVCVSKGYYIVSENPLYYELNKS